MVLAPVIAHLAAHRGPKGEVCKWSQSGRGWNPGPSPQLSPDFSCVVYSHKRDPAAWRVNALNKMLYAPQW